VARGGLPGGCLGFLGWDFRVDAPPELIAEVRALAERYERALRSLTVPATIARLVPERALRRPAI
jgi:hypothetical protein